MRKATATKAATVLRFAATIDSEHILQRTASQAAEGSCAEAGSSNEPQWGCTRSASHRGLHKEVLRQREAQPFAPGMTITQRNSNTAARQKALCNLQRQVLPCGGTWSPSRVVDSRESVCWIHKALRASDLAGSQIAACPASAGLRGHHSCGPRDMPGAIEQPVPQTLWK